MVIKSVAIIGLGPAGAITIDALIKEGVFDRIEVFERKSAPGGCWLEDPSPPAHLHPDTLSTLALRKADTPIPIPTTLPCRTLRNTQQRYAESSVYPYLETNVDSLTMSYSQEPIPEIASPLSISKHGADTPFRHHSIIREFVEGLVNRNDYQDLITYNTSVERATKMHDKWRLVLRREYSDGTDSWSEAFFDAVVVASGHFNVPYIPSISGLSELEREYPGSVKHSKQFRGRNEYIGKKVIVVGASVSGADIAYDLVGVAKGPVYAVVKGHKANVYFSDEAFRHPGIMQKPSISHIDTDGGKRRVHFIDGSVVDDVDVIIFGTGYSWSLPFLPHVEMRNNRVPDLYQHVVYNEDPSLLSVGAVGAGLTFKIFEWQAVYAARLLAGRGTLPSLDERRKWEAERIEEKGDGPGFIMIFPDFKEYFERLRELAGEPGFGKSGRRLPPFEEKWVEVFMAGHERRKKWWREENEKARQVAPQLSQPHL